MLHYHKYINVAANICYHHPMVMCRCQSAEMTQPLSVGHLSNNNNNNKRKYSSLDDDECVHIDSLDHHHHHIDNNQKKQRTTSTTQQQQQQHQPVHHRSSPKLPPQVSSFRMDQCIQLFEYYTQNTNNSQELIMSYNHPFFQLPNHNTTTTTIIPPTNYTSTASSGLELMMQHMGIQNMFNIHYFLFMYKLILHKKKQHFTSSDAVAAVDDRHSQVMMTMKITRNDWMFLMFQNQVDSIEKLCHWVRIQLMHETTMWSMDQVKQFMTFAFQLLVVIKNSSHLVQNQRAATMTKCVDIVVAAHALYCIMRERSVHVDSFCRYLLHQSKHKVMTMDQWKVFIDWSMTIRPDFSNYAQDDAWPSLYDDHVTYMGMMNKTNIC